MIALFCTLALAGDVVFLEPGQTFKAPEKSVVLSVPKFDACLAKAQALEDTRGELVKVRDLILEEQEKARDALDQCNLAAANAQAANVSLKKDVVALRNRQTLLLGVGVVLGAVIVAESYLLLKAVD